MELLKTNILFPTDFEEAYNRLYKQQKPRYSGGSGIVGIASPIDTDKYRDDARKQERSKALQRSIEHPRSRLYPSVTVRGGDIRTEEGMRLIPKLLEKRAADYRRLAGQEVPEKEGGPSGVSPAFVISSEIDKLLSIILDTISAGLFSTDTIEAGQEVLQLLLKSGNLLSTRQLEMIYSDIQLIVDNLVEPTTAAAQRRSADNKRVYSILSTLMDTIRRTIRAILSRANLSAKQRSVFQRSVRQQATSFYKKQAKLSTEERPPLISQLPPQQGLPEIGELEALNPITTAKLPAPRRARRRRLVLR